MHCLGLDQEFQLAKIPVQTLGGTPDVDFLGLDLAGRPFGGDFEQLSPWKMKKTNVPYS